MQNFYGVKFLLRIISAFVIGWVIVTTITDLTSSQTGKYASQSNDGNVEENGANDINRILSTLEERKQNVRKWCGNELSADSWMEFNWNDFENRVRDHATDDIVTT